MPTDAPHLKPIVLLPVRARQVADSGTRSAIPNPIPSGLYESVHAPDTSARTGPVPPLAYFCIRTLANYADQVYGIGSHRIGCQPQVLHALSPSAFGDIDATTRCLCKLDPRLWSIIVQVYSGLPKGLQNYHIPLGDKYLPLLQAIPSTPSFALITVLNLARSISDETSHALKSLHNLCALDISQTSVSHLGIRHFAPTIANKQSDPRYGTQGLRILRLCDCPEITDQVISAVSSFPLLAVLGSYRLSPCCQTAHSAIDLRGTGCNHDLDPGAFRASRKSQRNLFQCSLQDALQRLRGSDSRDVLFSHPDPFVIHINTQFHPRWPQRPDRPKPAPATSAFFSERSGAVTSSSTTSAYERFHRHEDIHTSEAEKELREWICSMLGDAGNETRILEIANFIMQRWEYNPERLEPDGSLSRFDSDPGRFLEYDDSIDSWDESSSTESGTHFCGYEISEDVVEEVFGMVEGARESHETAMRFYGLDPRIPKTVMCHCKELRGTAMSSAETTPPDRYFMLVRDPPPWDSVYGPDAPPLRTIRLTTKPSLSISSNLNLNRSSMRAKKSTQEMLGMIAQRRNLPSITVSPSPISTQTISTNPFRKDSNGDSVRGGSEKRRRGHGNSTQGWGLDPVPGGPTPKRMKSISEIPVPPRPTPTGTKSQSQRANSSGGSETGPKKLGKLKQTTLLGAFGKRT